MAVRGVAGALHAQRICQSCLRLLGVTGAGIGVVTSEGNRGVFCATDETAELVEDLLFLLGEGPGIDAVDSGADVLVPDLAGAEGARWPAFREAAGTSGIQAVFAFPLRLRATLGASSSVGAMSFYRDRPGQLSAGQLPAARMAADAAAVTLLQLGSGQDDPFKPDPSARSSYRLEVHQATGMVKAQLGVTPQEALLRLRASAFTSGRPLAAVAQDVLDRRVRFAREDL